MSKRTELAPTIIDREVGTAHEGREYHHPAYGTISTFNTTQGGPGANLFGSKIKHHQYIGVEIHGASLIRRLNNDWIHSEETVCRFSMTEAQFASLVANHGKAAGTPITFDYRPKQPFSLEAVPYIPDEDVTQVFAQEMKKEVRERVHEATRALAVLSEMMASGKISSKTLREQLKVLDAQINGMPSTMQFIADQFQEQMEKSTLEAREQVEAQLAHSIKQAGLEHLGSTHTTAPAPQDKPKALGRTLRIGGKKGSGG